MTHGSFLLGPGRGTTHGKERKGEFVANHEPQEPLSRINRVFPVNWKGLSFLSRGLKNRRVRFASVGLALEAAGAAAADVAAAAAGRKPEERNDERLVEARNAGRLGEVDVLLRTTVAVRFG